jgi:hypothetical protein
MKVKKFKMNTWEKTLFHKMGHLKIKTVKFNLKLLRITQIFQIHSMSNIKEEVVGKILAKKAKKFHMKRCKKEEECRSITRTLIKNQRKRNRDL